jgi:ABC-2 type transport system ATP-binding protein
VLLSTHVLPEVEHTCSRLLIINKGKLAADGPVSELIHRARGAATVTLEASGLNVGAGVADIAGVSHTETKQMAAGRTRVTLAVDGGRDVRPELFRLAVDRGWTLYELHQESASLEDLFRDLTQGGAV